MGFPKIPDAKEIADMTADAMQPMMDQLETISDQLERLIDIQQAVATAQGVTIPPAKLKSTG